MSERYQLPKRSWFVPFGPVNGVDLVKIDALQRNREVTGAAYSHGTQLSKLEQMFHNSTQVTSQLSAPRENCTYHLHGKPDSAMADKPGTLFVIRDGAIISIKHVNRMDWEAML